MALPSQVRGIAFREALQLPTARIATLATPIGHKRGYATYNTNANALQSSVNATEVSHFNTLASSWWEPHGSSRLLHLMNPFRHQFMRQCIANDPSPPAHKLKILDVGCGGGIFAESAARLCTTASVTAIDPTLEVIAIARKHQRTDPLLLEPGRLEYKNISIEQLPLPNSPGEGFDMISLFEVIEHIQNPSPFLSSILQHLKPGGWLIGSTIARTNTSWFTTKLVAEEVLRMVPQGTHDWTQYIQPNELWSWARAQSDLEVAVSGSGWQQMGVVYVPGLGWKEVRGSEDWGNYFFGMRRAE